jgi:hypothetical protein
VPLSEATVALMTEWKERARNTAPEALMFSTWSGKPISPNNVLRQWVLPARAKLNRSNATWLTFCRTYASGRTTNGSELKFI